MATVAAIITAAFKKIGIDDPTEAQTASALISLNNLIGTWGIESLQPSITRENFPVTAGDAEYTIGASGDFNTVRPIKIDTAFLRDSEGYDYPLEVVAAKDYNDVTYKSSTEKPSAIYFVPEITLAKIIFDCLPDASYTLYIESWKPFTEFATTAETLTLPNEYKEALVYNLAVSLAEDWDRVVSQTVLRRADETKDLLETSIASKRPVPTPVCDLFLSSHYNITTDSYT